MRPSNPVPTRIHFGVPDFATLPIPARSFADHQRSAVGAALRGRHVPRPIRRLLPHALELPVHPHAVGPGGEPICPVLTRVALRPDAVAHPEDVPVQIVDAEQSYLLAVGAGAGNVEQLSSTLGAKRIRPAVLAE